MNETAPDRTVVGGYFCIEQKGEETNDKVMRTLHYNKQKEIAREDWLPLQHIGIVQQGIRT